MDPSAISTSTRPWPSRSIGIDMSALNALCLCVCVRVTYSLVSARGCQRVRVPRVESNCTSYKPYKPQAPLLWSCGAIPSIPLSLRAAVSRPKGQRVPLTEQTQSPKRKKAQTSKRHKNQSSTNSEARCSLAARHPRTCGQDRIGFGVLFILFQDSRSPELPLMTHDS